MKSWDTAESALFGRRIGQIQNTLRAEGNRQGETHVPVDAAAAELVPSALRWIESALVDVHPHVGSSPKLRKRRMNSRRSAIGVDRRMMKQRHPIRAIAVPSIGLLGICSDEFIDRRRCRRGGFGRYGVVKNYESVFVPMPHFVGRQHRVERRRIPLTGERRVDARDPLFVNRTMSLADPLRKL